MKILLCEHNGKEYVWVTAKYNGKKFVVDGNEVDYWRIVSVMNDNRKNYIKCSSCGKIFPRKGKQFARHKDMSATNAPCLKCPQLRVNEKDCGTRKFVMNDDGTYTMKTETPVNLVCRYSSWTSYYIDSDEAKMHCKCRQCGNAHAMEIVDTFTTYPGVFDHIITVDKILDNGYERIGYFDGHCTEYVLDSTLGIMAYVNSLGIVDRFSIETREFSNAVWYSKKYNLLFTSDGNGNYEVFCADPDNETLKYIANLYK